MQRSRLTIGGRMFLSYLLIIILGLLSSFYGCYVIFGVDREVRLMTDLHLDRVTKVSVFKEHMGAVGTSVGQVAMLADDAGRAKERANVQTLKQQDEALMKALLESADTSGEKALIEKLGQTQLAYYKAAEKAIEMGINNLFEEMSQHVSKAVAPARQGYADALAEIDEIQRNAMHESADLVTSTATQAGWLILIVAIIVGIVGAVLARITALAIVPPIRAAAQLTQAVAEGDLTSKLEGSDRPDELGKLMQSLGDMNNRLTHMVRQIQQNAENISNEANEIARGNADLSFRTETQAANLQQTAASLHELSETVRGNVDAAQLANHMAKAARLAAEEGGSVVAKVVSTMDQISVASTRISDITGVIDGIAFQTNILALNAAVEAARAGEQGRGFAVVAGEVRTLAGRAAEAAKEIKKLTGESANNVENGQILVRDAGKSMTNIVAQVQNFADQVDIITASADKQNVSIQEINHAAEQLDGMTQQNAAMVELAAAAAEGLRRQSSDLVELVSRFKVQH
ncbi:MAG: hypothetical protein C4K60_14425 [Ideonella sp. MAG2]|nr:MAG: hypothetical protein C4K60_14425 [Ideonella sp. MAG2]